MSPRRKEEKNMTIKKVKWDEIFPSLVKDIILQLKKLS